MSYNKANKYYRVLCEYETVMYHTVMIHADTPEEAEEKARSEFKAWNDKWLEIGGNDKKLLGIKVEDV